MLMLMSKFKLMLIMMVREALKKCCLDAVASLDFKLSVTE